MAGSEVGFATQLELLNRKCLFTDCYWHVSHFLLHGIVLHFVISNLVIGDVIWHLSNLPGWNNCQDKTLKWAKFGIQHKTHGKGYTLFVLLSEQYVVMHSVNDTAQA